MVTQPGIRALLLAFHKEAVKSAETFFADASAGFLNEQIMRGVRPSPAAFAKLVREAKVEDGSVYAAFRDKLAFHRAAVEFIEGLPS